MASRSAGSASCTRAKPPRASSRSRSCSAKSISTASTSCRCASPPRARSRASSPSAATFPSFSTRASRGRRSTRRSPRCRFPSSSTGAPAKSSAIAKLGAQEYSLLLGVTFQAPTAPCAKKSCRASRRRSSRQWAKPARVSGRNQSRIRPSFQHEPALTGISRGAILKRSVQGAEVTSHVADILGIRSCRGASLHRSLRHWPSAPTILPRSKSASCAPSSWSSASASCAPLPKNAPSKAEALLDEQSPAVDQLKQEIRALRTERDQVRQRVERLLAQLDALEI